MDASPLDSGHGALPAGSDAPRHDPYGLAGQTVTHYAVERPIGQGGMGVVYLARDERLGRRVALKFLPPALSRDAGAKARLLAEARAASSLDHPNICTVHEVGESEDGRLFIAMAYYEGETLRRRLEGGGLPAPRAARYAVQLASALAHAHDAGVVHRDVKPGNVLVTAGDTVKLLDFGIAKAADVHLTRDGTTLGTAAYLSPEQARGDAVDARTDVWALGVVLYEMLAGVRPFRAAYEQAVVYGILHEPPRPLAELNPEVPVALARAVHRCLEKDPAARYADGGDVLAALEAALADPPEVAAGGTDAQALGWGRWVGALAVAVGVLAVLVLTYADPDASGPERGAASAAMPARPAEAGVRSVAVLPFVNVGGDPATQPFIDGLTYTIGATLSGMERFVDELSVLPTEVALAASGGTPIEAARTLGADLVVSGSVQRALDRIRLTLGVYDAAAGRRLGSRIIDRQTADLLALQDSVALALAHLLDLELSAAAARALRAGGTDSPGAFDFYTQARGYLQHYEDARNVDAAVRLFERAIEADSTYALAYAGLGEAYWRRYDHTREPQWADAAAEAAERAAALGGDLAPVRVTLGMVYKGTGRYEAAEREFQRALALDSLDAAAHQQLAATYYYLGRLDDAEAEYQRAIALKPGAWAYYNNLGFLYNAQGRHEEAIPLYRRVVELRPDNPWGYNNVGAQYHNLGRLDSAAVWYRRATQANPAALGATARAYQNLGELYVRERAFDQAAQMHERAVALDSTSSEAWAMLADAYLRASDPAKARAAWERMLALDARTLQVNPSDEDALAGLALGSARVGRPEQAREALERLEALPQKRAAILLDVAMAYEVLGARDRALFYIAEALGAGLRPDALDAAPAFEHLRTDPRFQALLAE